MIIWIDAQLSPALAPWITANFGVESRAVRELGLHGAKDRPIFQAAREAEAVVMTKDSDFLVLLDTGLDHRLRFCGSPVETLPTLG